MTTQTGLVKTPVELGIDYLMDLAQAAAEHSRKAESDELIDSASRFQRQFDSNPALAQESMTQKGIFATMQAAGYRF